MIGRAGRKGVDTEGESILLCRESDRKRVEQLVRLILLNSFALYFKIYIFFLTLGNVRFETCEKLFDSRQW